MPAREGSEPTLTKGSKWKVRSIGDGEPIVSIGVFKGYIPFGHDSAIGIELDSTHGEDAGRIRVIPCVAVLSLDLISIGQEEKEKGTEERGVYFG
ncbi:MAG: hypothetical protein LUQ55_05600 [Methanomassiliicoccales archaeon]|nr:hypothetical protein [Methanomassiliicoccales archaeon]MDD1773049.1 hypothetical protein [Methanomassiliicoccales archaeon]